MRAPTVSPGLAATLSMPASPLRLPVRPLLLLSLPLAALLLSACAGQAGPPPATTLAVPAQWRSHIGPDGAGQGGGAATADNAGATAAGIERGWWSAFGDPALSALVSAALDYNGDLRIARARVREFQARTAIAHAAQLPTLDAQAAPARVRTLNGFAQPFVTNVYQGGLQANYELDVWGKLDHANAAALAGYQAEQASADAVALSIAATVASSYLNLRGLDAQLELAQATLRLREQSRELARREFDVGYSSRLELVQAESEYDATAELVPQLERSIGEQENALSVLAGRSPERIARGRRLAELSPPPVPAGLPSELLRRRPDIYRAEQTVLAQNANLIAVRDQMLPSFKMTVGGGVENFNFSKLVNAPTALWNLTLGMTAPLYEGGRLQAQTDIAAAQRDASVYAYDNVVRTAFAETENGLDAVYRLTLQEVQTRARRDSAAEALRIARNRHRNGYASYLEELDAQRTLYNADVGLLQLRTRMLIASVDLYRALGGGWSADANAARY